MDSTIIKSGSPQIDLSTIENLKDLIPTYHQDYDAFYLQYEKPRPATSYDINGLVWLRVDVETGEVVGLQIDDFESIFLKKYPEIAEAWQEVKPLCIRPKLKKSSQEARDSFLLIMFNFLLSLFKNNPHQMGMQILPA